MKHLALALLLGTFVSTSIVAHEDIPAQLGLLVEYYEIDHKDLPAILLEYQEQPNASGLLKKVEEMEKNGKSRMVDSTYIITKSGQRAKIESIREVIYPTEYDPPEIPQKVTGPIDPGVDITTPTNPTAYEMRPVGITLEVDPVVSINRKFVELNIAPELVEFHGFQDWGKDESVTQMPLFHAQKVSTAILVNFDSSELLGVSVPASAHGKNGSGKRMLSFVTPMLLEPAVIEDEPANEEVPPDQPMIPIPSENPAPPKQISTITEYIEVDAKLASRIARQITGNADATKIRRRLDNAIKGGKARILESSTLLTRSGQRAKAESIREFIYPTEYDPAELPEELRGPIKSGLDFKTSIGATAFEMRPTGVTVELDPFIWDRSTIMINIAPEIVMLVNELVYGQGHASARQPVFESLKISTSARIADGTSMLLGIHSLETARAAKIATEEERKAVRDRRILVFVTAKIKTLK